MKLFASYLRLLDGYLSLLLHVSVTFESLKLCHDLCVSVKANFVGHQRSTHSHSAGWADYYVSSTTIFFWTVLESTESLLGWLRAPNLNWAKMMTRSASITSEVIPHWSLLPLASPCVKSTKKGVSFGILVTLTTFLLDKLLHIDLTLVVTHAKRYKLGQPEPMPIGISLEKGPMSIGISSNEPMPNGISPEKS